MGIIGVPLWVIRIINLLPCFYDLRFRVKGLGIRV